MTIHNHAFNDKEHLFTLEVTARQRGQWGGYVELRTIKTTPDVAKKIEDGNQRNFVGKGIDVLASGDGNVKAKGPRSEYAKSLAKVQDTFNTYKETAGMQDGFMHVPDAERDALKATNSKKALLDGLDKPFVACAPQLEQQERQQQAPRRM